MTMMQAPLPPPPSTPDALPYLAQVSTEVRLPCGSVGCGATVFIQEGKPFGFCSACGGKVLCSACLPPPPPFLRLALLEGSAAHVACAGMAACPVQVLRPDDQTGLLSMDCGGCPAKVLPAVCVPRPPPSSRPRVS